jgi:hypothetical protein
MKNFSEMSLNELDDYMMCCIEASHNARRFAEANRAKSPVTTLRETTPFTQPVGHAPAEGKDTMDKYEEIENQGIEANRRLTLDSATENLAIAEGQRIACEEYAARQAGEPAARQVQEADAILSGGRADDATFAEHMKELDKARHPLNYLSESEARKINETLHLSQPTGTVVQ